MSDRPQNLENTGLMIREFDWRDLTLLHRLAPEGVCLHAETWFTRGVNNWLSALRAYVAPGSNTITLVVRQPTDEAAMFGQLVHASGQHWAQVHYLAPQPVEDSLDAWTAMLLAMAQIASERGAHHLVAEIDDGSPANSALRQAGFVSYTHQRIWQFAGSTPVAEPPAPCLRRLHSIDEPAVHHFYKQLVPGLVRHVEPPLRSEDGYLWQQHGEVLAYFDVSRGPLGYWVRPFVHPEAQTGLDDLLAELLTLLTPGATPIYVCVRSYQGGFQGALEAHQFIPVAYQAMMVKRVTAAVMVPQFETAQMPATAASATGSFKKPPLR